MKWTKVVKAKESFNIDALIEKYNENYDFVYDHNDKVAGYEEAVASFDDYIKIPEFKKIVEEFNAKRQDFISSDREAGAFMFACADLGILDKMDQIIESNYNKPKASLNKKAGESYGWVVKPEDAWDKLQLWIDAVGAEQALDDITKAMGTDELSSCLAFIFRNNDFREGLSDNEDEDDEDAE